MVSAAAFITVFQLCSAVVTLRFPSVFSIEIADIFSLTFGNILTGFYYFHSARSTRQTLLFIAEQLWGTRLALYLALRTKRDFHDSRLDNFRKSLSEAKGLYFGHVLWISLSLLPIWVGMSPAQQAPLNYMDYISFAMFCVGFMIEVVADAQKTIFYSRNRRRPKQEQEPYCKVGLFRWCRFPNYFGDWLLWTALSILALRTEGTYMVLVLPVCSWFVLLLFYKGSIPIAIESTKRKCSEEQFQDWCSISMFVPRRPQRKQP